MFRVDLVFIIGGVLSLVAMIIRLAVARRRNAKAGWGEMSLWLAFTAGLMIQGLFAPLEVLDGHFVIPFSALKADPAALVMQARWRQATATLLTLAGGLGLLFQHRKAFLMK